MRMGAFAIVELQKLRHDRTELFTRMVQPALWLLIFGQTFNRLHVINTGDVPFVSLFCYAADAGQDYGIIADAGGMATLVVTDGEGGWTTRPNPDHRGYAPR